MEVREAELKKAMSLNYLKPVEPQKVQPQINKKKPTPENISALKDALMSVIGGVDKNKVKEEPIHEEKREYVPQAPVAKAPEPKPVSTPAPAPVAKPSIKEIPEEELRKMLEI